MSKELTKESISEFKKLKKWVTECPIEATMKIQELQKELDSFEERTCPNCNDWSSHLAKQCHVCEGFRIIYLKYRTEDES